jgi:hypothetical protein
MSISAADRLKVARYTGADPVMLGLHIDTFTLEGLISSSTETAVAAELTRWTDNNLDTSFVVIEAGPAGFKGRIDPDDLRESIRENLIVLLLLRRAPWLNSSDSQFSVQLYRA